MTATADHDPLAVADEHAAEIAKSAAAGDVVLVYGPPTYLANAYDAVLDRLAPERFLSAARTHGRQYIRLAGGGHIQFRHHRADVVGMTADLIHIWPGASIEHHQQVVGPIVVAGARLLTEPTDQPTTQGDPFLGGERISVSARFRYRLNSGQLYLGIKIDDPEAVLQAAFDAVIERIYDGTDEHPIMYGHRPTTDRPDSIVTAG